MAAYLFSLGGVAVGLCMLASFRSLSLSLCVVACGVWLLTSFSLGVAVVACTSFPLCLSRRWWCIPLFVLCIVMCIGMCIVLWFYRGVLAFRLSLRLSRASLIY